MNATLSNYFRNAPVPAPTQAHDDFAGNVEVNDFEDGGVQAPVDESDPELRLPSRRPTRSTKAKVGANSDRVSSGRVKKGVALGMATVAGKKPVKKPAAKKPAARKQPARGKKVSAKSAPQTRARGRGAVKEPAPLIEMSSSSSSSSGGDSSPLSSRSQTPSEA